MEAQSINLKPFRTPNRVFRQNITKTIVRKLRVDSYLNSLPENKRIEITESIYRDVRTKLDITNTDLVTGKVRKGSLDGISDALASALRFRIREWEKNGITLTGEKIRSILTEEQLVNETDIMSASLLEKKIKISQDLINPNTEDAIWRVMLNSIKSLGIDSGGGVYEINEFGEFKSKEREGLMGDSSYKKAKRSWGEKEWIEYLYSVIQSRATDPKAKSEGKIPDLNSLRVLKKWEFKNREVWSDCGFTKELVRKTLKGKSVNLDEAVDTLFLGSIRRELSQRLVEMVYKRLCLPDALLEKYGEILFREFLDEKKKKKEIRTEKEESELRKVYDGKIALIKEKASKLYKVMASSKDRSDISKTYFRDKISQLSNMAEINGWKNVDSTINDMNNPIILETATINYCYALEGIEMDKERAHIKKEGTPECVKSNTYWLVASDHDHVPMGLILANSHKELAEQEDPKPLTHEQEIIRDSGIAVVDDMINLLALALKKQKQDKEAIRVKEQSDELLLFGRKMNYLNVELGDRFQQAATMLSSIFRRGERPIDVTISVVTSEAQEKMEVIATTDKELNKLFEERPGERQVSYFGKIDKVSALVARDKQTLFVRNGQITKGQWQLSSEDMLDIKRSDEDIWNRLEIIRQDKKSNFMSIPIKHEEKKERSGEEKVELFGVISVKGDVFTDTDMQFLQNAAEYLVTAVINNKEREKVKRSAEENSKIANEMSQIAEERKKELDEKTRLIAKKEELESRLIKSLQEMEYLAKHDPMLKLLIRGELNNDIEKLVKEVSKLPGDDLSVVMLDVDHFKLLNDKFGHGVGDRALIRISGIIQEEIDLLKKDTQHDRDSEEDMKAYRYGGEEIAILLRHFDKERALSLCEKIRKRIDEMEINNEKGEAVKVTISSGVSSFAMDFDAKAERPDDDLLRKADEALYFSKGNGRNQCTPYADDIVEKVKVFRLEEKNALLAVEKLLTEVRLFLETNVSIVNVDELIKRIDLADVTMLKLLRH